MSTSLNQDENSYTTPGSFFDDFLLEEGILKEVEHIALKNLITKINKKKKPQR